MRRVLLALLIASCAAPETPWMSQHKYAESLKAAEVKPTSEPAAAVRVLKVRAWADPDYQAQTPRWSAHIEEQLSRASKVLEAQFGVRLELLEARPWPRAGSSAHLREVLDQLLVQDRGTDVDWVIGFTASLDVFSAAQDQLGAARLFSKHMVVRGIVSAAELDAVNENLRLLSTAEREDLVRQRRLHKETAVLLHEWAHTLGAFHDRALDTLMAPVYDKSMARFSEASARVIGWGLEYRGHPQARELWAKAYKAEVRRAKDAIWDDVEKQHVLAVAEQFFSSGGELDPQDARKLEEASVFERAGDYRKAMDRLRPLLHKYPDSSAVHEMACAIAQEAKDDELAVCRRAAQLDTASAQILMMAAHLELTSGSRPDAVPLLARAEEKLGSEASAWLWLSQLDLAAGALTAAERAANHEMTRETKAVIKEVRRTRAFVGFPAAHIDREADYVSLALAAHDLIDKGQLAAALAKAKELEKSFPHSPAPAVIRCRVRSRERSVAQIESACADAAKGAPNAFLPQYILGLVHSAHARWADAEATLKRAIEIDASTREVWQSLAAVQLRRNEKEAARESAESFQQRFGAALTPSLWPPGWAAAN